MAKNYTQLKQKSQLRPQGFSRSQNHTLWYCAVSIIIMQDCSLCKGTHHPWVTKTWAYTSLHGVLGGLINGGAYMRGGLYTTCNWTRKSASEQAMAVLIKICFAFTGFFLVFKMS